MKKFLATILVLAIMCCLIACGSKSEPSIEATETEEFQNDNVDIKESEDSEADSDEVTSKENLDTFKTNATLEETVIYSNEAVKITITELTYTNYAVELNFTFENNSNVDLSFVSGSNGYCCNSINGIMIPFGYVNCDVTAGNKATETMSLSFDELQLYGIDEIADIEIGFDISDDDYNNTYTGPVSIKTSVAGNYEYKDTAFRDRIRSKAACDTYEYTVEYFSDETALTNNNISLISYTLVENKEDGKLLFLEFTNSGSDQINIDIGNISINGVMVDDYSYETETVNSGKSVVIVVTLENIVEKRYLDALGINSIDSIGLEVELKDMEYTEVSDPKYVVLKLSENKPAVDTDGSEVYKNNNITIVSKAILASNSEYSKDMTVLLLVSNEYGKTIDIDDELDSLSVNGYMFDYILSGTSVSHNGCALIEISLDESSLEEYNITSPEDITNIELTLKIKDEDYNNIDNPKIEIEY